MTDPYPNHGSMTEDVYTPMANPSVDGGPTQPPNLPRVLPCEIWGEVAEWLPPEAMRQCRLAGRDISNEVTRLMFRTLRIAGTEPARLQALIILLSPHLAKHVRKVVYESGAPRSPPVWWWLRHLRLCLGRPPKSFSFTCHTLYELGHVLAAWRTVYELFCAATEFALTFNFLYDDATRWNRDEYDIVVWRYRVLPWMLPEVEELHLGFQPYNTDVGNLRITRDIMHSVATCRFPKLKVIELSQASFCLGAGCQVEFFGRHQPTLRTVTFDPLVFIGRPIPPRPFSRLGVVLRFFIFLRHRTRLQAIHLKRSINVWKFDEHENYRLDIVLRRPGDLVVPSGEDDEEDSPGPPSIAHGRLRSDFEQFICRRAPFPLFLRFPLRRKRILMRRIMGKAVSDYCSDEEFIDFDGFRARLPLDLTFDMRLYDQLLPAYQIGRIDAEGLGLGVGLEAGVGVRGEEEEEEEEEEMDEDEVEQMIENAKKREEEDWESGRIPDSAWSTREDWRNGTM